MNIHKLKMNRRGDALPESDCILLCKDKGDQVIKMSKSSASLYDFWTAIELVEPKTEKEELAASLVDLLEVLNDEMNAEDLKLKDVGSSLQEMLDLVTSGIEGGVS